MLDQPTSSAEQPSSKPRRMKASEIVGIGQRYHCQEHDYDSETGTCDDTPPCVPVESSAPSEPQGDVDAFSPSEAEEEAFEEGYLTALNDMEPQAEAAASSFADEIFERSKRDDARIVGSEIRQAIGELRRELQFERERHAEEAGIAAIVRMYAAHDEHSLVRVVSKNILALAAADTAARKANER